MEEGVIIKRLSSSNQNYGLLVDVGSLEGDDVFNFIEQYRRRLTRRRYIDPQTGRLSMKFNPLSVVEDIIVPTRQGSGGNIIPLNQNQTARGSIEDINYFQNKLIYSLDTPKLLLGKEEDVNAKSTSDTQMVVFLRLIRVIQTLLEPGIKDFYYNALLIQGFTFEEIGELKIEWPIFGTLDEERKWRIELLKMQVASLMSKDMELVDDYYIYSNILKMTDEEIEELTDRMDSTEKEIADLTDADLAGKETDDDDVFKTPEDEEPPDNKTSKGEEEPKENEKVKKEKVLSFYKENLKEKDYEIFKTIITNEDTKRTLHDLIELTKLMAWK